MSLTPLVLTRQKKKTTRPKLCISIGEATSVPRGSHKVCYLVVSTGYCFIRDRYCSLLPVPTFSINVEIFLKLFQK